MIVLITENNQNQPAERFFSSSLILRFSATEITTTAKKSEANTE
jgi:hypothetical protein